MVRTYAQQNVVEIARYASVPVINGLTDKYHPCQVLADVQTVVERFDRRDATDLKDLKVAWIGDGNNVAHSWIAAAGLCGFPLTLACPAERPPAADVLEQARSLPGAGTIEVVTDPALAARDAAVLNTDVWVSMGDDPQDAVRYREMFQRYRLDATTVASAREDAIVLHCLPAHRGEEISDEVIEGPHSAVWQQAENRLHVQKAILAQLMG
jgi:ornithine carbamoyltransferase